MYPMLPFGPLSLPTGPIFALFAMWAGLEIASRFARRLELDPDAVWNAGLIALLAGLIVARLWNVVQFWYIYADQPRLIFSLRPSGFALLPGAIGAGIACYAYLYWRALDPLRIAAAFAVGALAAAAILNISAYLTGSVLGVPSESLLAIPYFGEPRFPVALWRAAGMSGALLMVLIYADGKNPAQTIWLVLLGYSLTHLIFDAFLAEPALIGPFRVGQVLGLTGALLACLFLARSPSVASSILTVEM